VRRVRLRLVRGVEVEFVDRDVALRQFAEIAEKGTRFPLVVYGPEGCGKTALLRQAVEVLREWGYSVVYVNPLGEVAERLVATEDLREVVKRAWREVLGGVVNPAALVDLALAVASRALKRGKKRIAILADDIFQAVGVDRAELLVKTMLNLIEYPSADYDKIIVLVASSEGITRERVGMHRWAELRVMWNMPRSGFEQLYHLLPSPKLPFDEVWRWTGGNPDALERLFGTSWDVEKVVEDLAVDKGLSAAFAERWKAHLAKALEDPDYLWEEPEAEGLAKELVEKNLVVLLKGRRPDAWVDQPPPERDPELGIGRHYAWQTPLHREAVRRALGLA